MRLSTESDGYRQNAWKSRLFLGAPQKRHVLTIVKQNLISFLQACGEKSSLNKRSKKVCRLVNLELFAYRLRANLRFLSLSRSRIDSREETREGRRGEKSCAVCTIPFDKIPDT